MADRDEPDPRRRLRRGRDSDSEYGHRVAGVDGLLVPEGGVGILLITAAPCRSRADRASASLAPGRRRLDRLAETRSIWTIPLGAATSTRPILGATPC